MSRIDLSYIGANCLTQLLSAPGLTMEELVLELRNLTDADVARANGYVFKYDNVWDKSEGTHVDQLKYQLETIENNIAKLMRGDLK